MIRLTLRENPADSLDEFTYKAANPTRGEQDEIDAAVREGFRQNFSFQGGPSGAWRPLAARTVLERIRLGYPGTRPILVRSGDYMRSFVNAGHRDHYAALERTGAGWRMVIGSEDERVDELEGGTHKIPARPVTELSSWSESRIGDALDRIMNRHAAAE